MPRLLLLNNSILFLCCSIYLGTGIVLVFFQFPLAEKLTIDTYYLVFIEPVANATEFFTPMTIIMILTCIIMVMTEWFSGLRWVPVIVLISIIVTTLIELYLIFPLNKDMTEGITEPLILKETLASWMNHNYIRFSFWIIQWLTMMYYFYNLARKARMDK